MEEPGDQVVFLASLFFVDLDGAVEERVIVDFVVVVDTLGVDTVMLVGKSAVDMVVVVDMTVVVELVVEMAQVQYHDLVI